MFRDSLAESLPVLSLLNLIQKEVRPLGTSLGNLAPVLLYHIVKQRGRSGIEPVVSKVEVEDPAPGNSGIQQPIDQLERIERLPAAPNARNDMHEIERSGRREAIDDVTALRDLRKGKRESLLDELGIAVDRWGQGTLLPWH